MEAASAMEEVGTTGDEQPTGEELQPSAAGAEGGVAETPVVVSPGTRGLRIFKPCCCDGGEKCLVKDHAAPTEEDPHPCKRTAGDRKTCQPCRKGRNRKRKKAAEDDPNKDPANPGGKRAPLAAAADTLARLSEGAARPSHRITALYARELVQQLRSLSGLNCHENFLGAKKSVAGALREGGPRGAQITHRSPCGLPSGGRGLLGLYGRVDEFGGGEYGGHDADLAYCGAINGADFRTTAVLADLRSDTVTTPTVRKVCHPT